MFFFLINVYNFRLVKNAKPVTYVTYEEAAELAYFGAEVKLLLSGTIIMYLYL